MTPMSGFRVLVVGASSGIGRAVGTAAAQAGARVAFAARREALVQEAAAAAGGGCAGVALDVRDSGECQAAVGRAAERLGGLDALVYAPAYLPLGALVDTSADTWRAVLETNLVGAAMVTAAALPHLAASPGGGRVVYLSSDAVPHPRPGLVPYIASKAALDTLLLGWRAEVPEVSFTRVVVGPTNTGLPEEWDQAEAVHWLTVWAEQGLNAGQAGVMEPADVAAQVLAVLASPVQVDDLVLEPRRG